MSNGIVEIHLAATRTEWITKSPLKLLFDHVRLWATAQHASLLHLGGGVGAKADSLYSFKSGFSKRRHAFYTWRWIINQPVYDLLNRTRNRFSDIQDMSPDNGFFPRYRDYSESPGNSTFSTLPEGSKLDVEGRGASSMEMRTL